MEKKSNTPPSYNKPKPITIAQLNSALQALSLTSPAPSLNPYSTTPSTTTSQTPVLSRQSQSPEDYNTTLQQLTSQCTQENTTLISERKETLKKFQNLVQTCNKDFNEDTIPTLLEQLPVIDILKSKYNIPYKKSNPQSNETKIARFRMLVNFIKNIHSEYPATCNNIINKVNLLKANPQKQSYKIQYYIPCLLHILMELQVLAEKKDFRINAQNLFYPPSKLEILFSHLLKHPSDNLQSQILKIHAHLAAYLKDETGSTDFLDFYIYEDTHANITTLLNKLLSDPQITSETSVKESLLFLKSKLLRVRQRQRKDTNFDFLVNRAYNTPIESTIHAIIWGWTNSPYPFGQYLRYFQDRMLKEQAEHLTPEEQKEYSEYIKEYLTP